MRTKVKPGRYILLFGVVAAALYFSREKLKSIQRPRPAGRVAESVDVEPAPASSDLLDFQGLRVRARERRGDTLFLENGGVVLLGCGDPRVARAILDTLLALEPDFDTIDLRIKGHAVVR